MPIIVAVVVAVTVVVLIVNVAEVAPAATVTLAGKVALDELDERATTTPPVGAGPLRVTVPVEDDPPATEVGDKLSDVTAAGFTVSVALTETPVSVPVIFAATVAVTGEVVTVNVVEVDPAGTVTVAGTTALLLLEARLTTKPPVGAGPVRAAVPVEALPPVTVAGVRAIELNAEAVIPKFALSDVVPSVAVSVAVVAAVTADVVTVNVALLAPGATVTVGGTTALALLDERVTVIPPPDAGPDNVTDPVELNPPTTEEGESVNVFKTTVCACNWFDQITPSPPTVSPPKPP